MSYEIPRNSNNQFVHAAKLQWLSVTQTTKKTKIYDIIVNIVFGKNFHLLQVKKEKGNLPLVFGFANVITPLVIAKSTKSFE